MFSSNFLDFFKDMMYSMGSKLTMKDDKFKPLFGDYGCIIYFYNVCTGHATGVEYKWIKLVIWPVLSPEGACGLKYD